MTNQKIFNTLAENESALFRAMSDNPGNEALRTAHAAAKEALEAFHRATGCTNQDTPPAGERPTVDALAVLDDLDKFRRTHQDDRRHPSDWCMRVMEAIVAEAAEFRSRAAWADALLADPATEYAREFGVVRHG